MSACLKQTSIQGCYTDAAGVRNPVVITYTHDDRGQPKVNIHNVGGAVIPLATLTNTVAGACVVPAPSYKIFSDGLTIAGPIRSATAPFAGAGDLVDIPALVAAQGGRLTSYTVTAFATTPGLAGLTPNQVLVSLISEQQALNTGETRNWSVQRNQDTELIALSITVEATGNAYAHVSWTYEA